MRSPGVMPLAIEGPLAKSLAGLRRSEVTFGIRPEDIELAVPDDPRPGIALPANFVEPIGPRTTIHLAQGEIRLKVITEKRFRTRARRQC